MNSFRPFDGTWWVMLLLAVAVLVACIVVRRRNRLDEARTAERMEKIERQLRPKETKGGAALRGRG